MTRWKCEGPAILCVDLNCFLLPISGLPKKLKSRVGSLSGKWRDQEGCHRSGRRSDLSVLVLWRCASLWSVAARCAQHSPPSLSAPFSSFLLPLSVTLLFILAIVVESAKECSCSRECQMFILAECSCSRECQMFMLYRNAVVPTARVGL